MIRRASLLAVVAVVATWSRTAAHEVRPAYLELTEVEGGRFEVVWKVPTRGGGAPLAGEEIPHPADAVRAADASESRTMPCGCPGPRASDVTFGALPIHPVLPGDWQRVASPRIERLPGAEITRWTVAVGEEGVAGSRIAVHGLEATLVDVLVRVALVDGQVVSRVLRPDAPSFTVETGAGPGVSGYLRLGIEHIIFGVDHLLFVLGLMLLVDSMRRLVKTITAFTVAHSITLGLATLGFVRVPPAPVEAVIALSIVFLACELVRHQRGEVGRTARQPWLVAFIFGLLHGFGFAGALSEVGLPPRDVPLALLLFNAGVELGQLAFVGLMLALLGAVKRLPVRVGPWLRHGPAYAIGSVAAFWLIQRITAVWVGS